MQRKEILSSSCHFNITVSNTEIGKGYISKDIDLPQHFVGSACIYSVDRATTLGIGITYLLDFLEKAYV